MYCAVREDGNSCKIIFCLIKISLRRVASTLINISPLHHTCACTYVRAINYVSNDVPRSITFHISDLFDLVDYNVGIYIYIYIYTCSIMKT